MKRNDVIGWVGVLLILAAFTLTTFGIINAENTTYGILNFLGALGIVISSYTKKDFQPVALNIIWLLIAAAGIIRSIL
jgi:hypothetical protein